LGRYVLFICCPVAIAAAGVEENRNLAAPEASP